MFTSDVDCFVSCHNPYHYWIVSIVGPLLFIAAFVHLYADKMKLPRTVGRIAGAIVSAMKSPPDECSILYYDGSSNQDLMTWFKAVCH